MQDTGCNKVLKTSSSVLTKQGKPCQTFLIILVGLAECLEGVQSYSVCPGSGDRQTAK